MSISSLPSVAFTMTTIEQRTAAGVDLYSKIDMCFFFPETQMRAPEISYKFVILQNIGGNEKGRLPDEQDYAMV